MFTVGSMFAGIGGICLAFKQAGFDVIWANEKILPLVEHIVIILEATT